jgi:hypothetical protein
MKKILTVAMLVLLATTLIVSCADPKTKTINITYDLNGGTLAEGVTNPSTATAGETVTPTGPTRDTDTQTVSNYSIDDYLYCDSASVTSTYTFKGWKVDGANDSTASETYTAGTEDVKLVAVWDTTSTAANCIATKLKSTVSTGTTVTLGYYTSALSWKVLSVDTTNKKALLFAANVVSTSMANGSGSTSDRYSWGDASPIYRWFNNTNSDGFLSQCRLTNVSMVANGNESKVFLLSENDLTTYLPNASDRTCGYSWWLRTGGTTQDACKYVSDAGIVYSDKNCRTNCAVRPAFWISL